MSAFEYSDLSSDDNNDEEGVVLDKKIKRSEIISRFTKELRLYYSNLFIDCFNLIDLFVKSKKLTYDSFLVHFDSIKFHQIYADTKKKKAANQLYVSPHHYISTAQDALAIASKFLRSRSKEARIGAVYLLYTLHKTQPLKTYLVRIKMEPKDYKNTKELVDTCLNQGLVHPAYYFYDLDIRKQIVICANAVSPSLEANYPRQEIRKHLGRVADRYFLTEYEDSKEFDPFSKLKLMEDQMRTELAYINKLSKMTLGHIVVSEYRPELSQALLQIENDSKFKTEIQEPSDKNCSSKQTRYKLKQTVAFPGKNDNVLDDMVAIVGQPKTNPKNKQKKTRKSIKKHKFVQKNSTLSTWEQIEDNSNVCGISYGQHNPTNSSLLNDMIETDSSCSTENDDDADIEDNYEDMIWGVIDKKNPLDILDEQLNQDQDINMGF